MDTLEFLQRCCAAGEVEINVKGKYFFSWLTGYVSGSGFLELISKAKQIAERNEFKELTDYQIMERSAPWLKELSPRRGKPKSEKARNVCKKRATSTKATKRNE